MKKVTIIEGGFSPEKKISYLSSQSVQKALKTLNYSFDVLEADLSLFENLKKNKPDVCFLATHGLYGEDGIIQSILEFLKIPYTGSGVIGSSVLMNKAFSKKLFKDLSVLSPKSEVYCVQNKEELKNIPWRGSKKVVKASRAGSSLGTCIVEKEKDFLKALTEAYKYDHEILVEDFIEGIELTTPVWFKKALPCIQIKTKTDFYNYDNKYFSKGQTDYLIPSEKPHLEKKCQEISEKLFEYFSLRQYARMDFMIDKKDQIYLIEINTLPGLSPHSLLPKSAEKKGLSFEELIKKLIETAKTDYEI